MTRPFYRLPETASIDLPQNGGLVRSGADTVLAPEAMMCTQIGVAFGPLHIATPGIVTIDDVSFLPGDDGGGWISFGAGAGVAAAGGGVETESDGVDPPTPSVERRGVLTLLGALLVAASYGPARVYAQEDGDEVVALNIAEFTIGSLDAPVSVSIIDAVEDVLPTTTEMLVDQEETRVGEIVSAGETVELLQQPGTVNVYLRDSKSKLAKLLSWVSSLLVSDESLTYRRTFPDGNMASDFDEGQFLTLTEHPAIIDPVEASDPDDTILEVGSTQIPHESRGASEAGLWSILDGSMIYEVGPNPPASEEWQVTTRLSGWQKYRQ